ncbi:DUF6531 domain-containing protein [Microbulbifer sp. ZKSA006]|uniref:DUF6531 domain-containing protein n=1 Tax=Microbulbifer sp. ZKSA006 TaxID=3243390 RepID=UPI004039BCA2
MIQLFIENYQGTRYTVSAGWTCKNTTSAQIDATEVLGMFDSKTLQLVYDQYLGLYKTPTSDTDSRQAERQSTPKNDAPGYLCERDKAIYLALVQHRLVIEEAPLPYSVLADLQAELANRIRIGLQQVTLQDSVGEPLTKSVVKTDSGKVKEAAATNITKVPSCSAWSLSIWTKDAAEVAAVVSPARQSFELSTEVIDYILYAENLEEPGGECVTSVFRGVITALGFNPNTVSRKQLRLSFNIAEVIYSDSILRGAVFHFAQNYIKTRYSLKVTDLVASGTFEIILTIALAALTKGDVTAVSRAKSARLLTAFRNIGDLMFDFARLKRQRTLLAKKTERKAGRKGTQANIQKRYGKKNSQASVKSDLLGSGNPQSQTPRRLYSSGAQVIGINRAKNFSEEADKSCSEAGENYTGDTCQSNATACTVGEIVHLKTGEVSFTLTDVALSGPLPLRIARTYRSSNSRDIGLGYGWTHTLSERLVWRPGQTILFFDAEGRVISLPAPGNSSRSHNVVEQLTLTRINDEHWVITTYGVSAGIEKHFKATGETGALRLTKICDSYGNFYQLHYRNECLIRVESSFGEDLYISPAEESSASFRIGALKRIGRDGGTKFVAHYEYSDEGSLIKAVDGSGCGEKYEYQKYNIKQRTLKTGYRFYFEWDTDGPSARCVRQWGDTIDGKPTCNYQFIWGGDGYRVTIIDTRGGQTHYCFNERGLPTYYCNGEGGETLYSYNDMGRISRVQLPSESDALREEIYQYDKDGRLVQKVDAGGNRYQIEYSSAGLPCKLTDPEGSSWQRRYNKYGKIVAIEDPLGNTTHYTYTPEGLIDSVTDPLGNVTRYFWEDEGRLSAIEDSLGRSICYQYGSDSLLNIVRSSQDKKTCYKYDEQGRVCIVSTLDGRRTQYIYNVQGLLVEIIEDDGTSTTYTYDGLGQVRSRTHSNGSRLEFYYDGECNLIGLKNEKGECYQRKYDFNNRLVEEVGFDGRATRYTYNPAGYLVRSSKVIDVESDVELDIYFERDLLGRLLRENAPDGVSSFRYNCRGQLIEAKNSQCRLRWEYDVNGRVIAEWQGFNKLSYQYDVAGNLVATTLPCGEILEGIYSSSGEAQGLRDYSVVGDINPLVEHKNFDSCGEDALCLLADNLGFHRFYDFSGDALALLPENPEGLTNARLDELSLMFKSDCQYSRGYQFAKTSVVLPDIFTSSETKFKYGVKYRDLAGEDVRGCVSSCGVDGRYNFQGYLVKELRGGEESCRARFYYNFRQQLMRVEKLKVEKGMEQFQEVIQYQYDPLGRCIRHKSYRGSVSFLWSGGVLVQEQRLGSLAGRGVAIYTC